MANAAYTRSLHEMDLPDLLYRAETVRELADHPGWKFVLSCIADHEAQMLQRLLNETTKPEDIGRLRGLLTGLSSAREAADSIVSHAADREREANKRHEAQEPQNG